MEKRLLLVSLFSISVLIISGCDAPLSRSFESSLKGHTNPEDPYRRDHYKVTCDYLDN